MVIGRLALWHSPRPCSFVFLESHQKTSQEDCVLDTPLSKLIEVTASRDAICIASQLVIVINMVSFI